MKRNRATQKHIDKYDNLPAKVFFLLPRLLLRWRGEEMIKCVPHKITLIIHEDLSLISR